MQQQRRWRKDSGAVTGDKNFKSGSSANRPSCHWSRSKKIDKSEPDVCNVILGSLIEDTSRSDFFRWRYELRTPSTDGCAALSTKVRGADVGYEAVGATARVKPEVER